MKIAKKKRRPRCGGGERNYNCGCGKSYLSYPALYTHVKNKHDGVFPIGSNAKRKIPRNVEEDCEHMFMPNVDRFLIDFEDFVSQIDNASADGRKQITEFDIDHLFGMLNSDTDKNISLLKTAMKGMLQLNSDKEKFDRLKDSLTINQILSFYFISIYPFCNYQFIKEYFLLIYMITKALNEKGDSFIEKSEKQKLLGNSNNRLFTEITDVYVIAEILNLFIAELFPHYLKTLKDERDIEFRYLGFEDDNIKNLILMCKNIANWLFHIECIDYRLEINVDF